MKRLTTLALLAGMLSAPALHSEEPGSGAAAPLSFPQLNGAADSERATNPGRLAGGERLPDSPRHRRRCGGDGPCAGYAGLAPAGERVGRAGGHSCRSGLGRRSESGADGDAGRHYPQRRSAAGGVSFTLPSDQVVIHSQLSLAVRVSPEMASRNATLQLMLNGQPLGTLPLGADGEDVSHYQLDIPPALMVSSNNLSVKINDGDTLQCQRDIHDSSRVTVLPTSHFSWESQQLNISDDLSHFPRPFFDSMQMTPADIAVSYGAKPSADVFSAAALVSSGWVSGRTIAASPSARCATACRNATVS